MTARRIVMLGEESLWEPSTPLGKDNKDLLPALLTDLRDTLMTFRRKHGGGKAIAAPQIGENLRVIYLYEPGPHRFLINPSIRRTGNKESLVWERCMSFPTLYVRTRRSNSCSVRYYDEIWRLHEEEATGDLSYVLQHECDHLDGLLTIQRAVDGKSFSLFAPRKRPSNTMLV